MMIHELVVMNDSSTLQAVEYNLPATIKIACLIAKMKVNRAVELAFNIEPSPGGRQLKYKGFLIGFDYWVFDHPSLCHRNVVV